MSRAFVKSLTFAVALAALVIGQKSALAQLQTDKRPASVPKLVPPTLSFINPGFEHQIKLKVTGSMLSGAPAGFTIDWMPLADYVANGNKWYGDNDYYRASFAGSEGGVGGTWNYNLKKGESTFIVIGESLFDDAGATTDDFYMLYYRTTYVFRIYANATADQPKSGWSDNFKGGTLPCGSECITKTQGYWKTHFPDDWPQQVLDDGLTLGNVLYTAQELEDIFNTPAAGNGLISLSHQLIAAKLNIIAFGLPSDPNAAARILDTIADADALIGDLVVPPVGTGFLAPADTSALNDELTVYNEKYDCD